MRGCFYRMRECFSQNLVFPAYAGMFLSGQACAINRASFPRVCGDVSVRRVERNPPARFSPRMRGCFHRAGWVRGCTAVFPAYAGMFPILFARTSAIKRFPRVCGDVSPIIPPLALASWFSPRMRGCFYPLKHGDNSTSCYL